MNNSTGKSDFIRRHQLWSDEQKAAAREVTAGLDGSTIDCVRLSFADQHGILRGKTLIGDAVDSSLRNGCTITTAILAKDTSDRPVFPLWQAGGGLGRAEMGGAGDLLMVPDPLTFQILPWAPRTGWMLCDLYFQDGSPVPFSTRQICQQAMRELSKTGFSFISGLELEFHVFRLEDAKLTFADATQPGTPPDISLIAQGYQYLAENRLDELDSVLELLRTNLLELGLPLRSVEAEYGPSQIEFTFNPLTDMGTADAAILVRSAVKQVCHRHGYHATFMCRPQGENLFSSGWHLHQSLAYQDTGVNAFVPESGDDLLAATGRRYVAGLLEHARAACVFTTPTLNGYKRYRPYSLAPDRILWGADNRGAMLRVIGGQGDSNTRVENRAGEPAANPFLYLAAQVYAGLDGIAADKEPATAADAPYDSDADALPGNLIEAVDALDASTMYRQRMGDEFVDYLVHIKRAEIKRFFSEVTDFEQREYFSIF